MFNKVVKYDFILRYKARVNAIRASSFIEIFLQISAEPIAFQRNLLGKLLRNRPFSTNRFSAKLASKIPAKSAAFSANLPLKIPGNLTFFPATYQKPCFNYVHSVVRTRKLPNIFLYSVNFPEFSVKKCLAGCVNAVLKRIQI